LLELSETKAVQVSELLRNRDSEAEKILEIYGPTLSSPVLDQVAPRLRIVDAEADHAIELLLNSDQIGTYRRLRQEEWIPGTIVDLPECGE
jgi:hypothetical protein